jgi:hypothetical protein
MGPLVPSSGAGSGKNADERKQIERQLEEDEDAEYYVSTSQLITCPDCRISKSHSLTTLLQAVAVSPRALTTCISRSTFTWESRVFSEFLFVSS